MGLVIGGKFRTCLNKRLVYKPVNIPRTGVNHAGDTSPNIITYVRIEQTNISRPRPMRAFNDVFYSLLCSNIQNFATVHRINPNVTEGSHDKETRSSATAEKQRVSCPHGGRVGLDPPAPSPLLPLATRMRMAESESHNVRTSSVPSVKCTLR